MNHNFPLLNVDTDSFTIYSKDLIQVQKREMLLKELNEVAPKGLVWEDDGFYTTICVIRAKNYALWDGKTVKIKGSAFKSSSRETALKELMSEFLDVMLKEELSKEKLNERLVTIYHKYILEALNVKDIKRWSSKKTITTKVLNPERTNEQKVFDALKGTDYSEGDKRWFYFKEDKSLSLVEHFDGNYDRLRLVEKIWETVTIFETIVDKNIFTKYHLKGKRKLLDELSNER